MCRFLDRIVSRKNFVEKNQSETNILNNSQIIHNKVIKQRLTFSHLSAFLRFGTYPGAPSQTGRHSQCPQLNTPELSEILG